MASRQDVARRFIENLSSGSPAMLDDLADPAEYHLIAALLGIGPFFGKQQIGEQFVPMIRQLFPTGLNMTIHQVLADGERVAAECSSDARLADGRTYANRYVFLFEFAGDRIKSVKEYNDSHYAKETLMPG